MRQRDRQTDGQTDSHSTMAYSAFYPSAISVNENITARPACTLHGPTVIVDKPNGGRGELWFSLLQGLRILYIGVVKRQELSSSRRQKTDCSQCCWCWCGSLLPWQRLSSRRLATHQSRVSIHYYPRTLSAELAVNFMLETEMTDNDLSDLTFLRFFKVQKRDFLRFWVVAKSPVLYFEKTLKFT